MKALILAAGYATRLYPLTLDKPKALLTVGKQTILDFVVDQINSIDSIDTIYLVTNSRFYSQFIEWKNAKKISKEIVIVDDNTTSDETKLGAIGDIEFVINSQKIDDDLLIMASDNIFTFHLKDFYNYFKDKNTDTILVKKINSIDDLKRMANVVTDDNGLVQEMVEKPSVPISNLAAFASYIYKKETLKLFKEYLDSGNNPDAPGFFPSWLCRKKSIYAYEFNGECYDIGTHKSYEEVNKIFK